MLKLGNRTVVYAEIKYIYIYRNVYITTYPELPFNNKSQCILN